MTQRKTSIALDLSDSDRQALYDDHAKRLLGYRRVLAAFLKQVLPELKPYPAGQIVTMIDPDIRISTKILHPDLKIRGLNTEYREKLRHRQDLPADESKGIRFDILFRVQLPAGAREILINIEIQKDKPKDYELLPRAVSYLGELIASQTDREYVAQDYDRLMPVCSIWIVAGQDRNTITAYNLTEKTTGEPDMWGKAELVQAVILGFNEESKPEPGEEPVWNLLRGLFSTTMSVVDRLGILEDYGIPTVQDVEEEVLDMCNLGQGVYEKGKRAGELQGIQQGIQQGIEQGLRQGLQQGIEQGQAESEQRISQLKQLMVEADRTEEFLAALDDRQALSRLYREFGIITG
ncbi:hypothetical protein [uncultured Faecalibaculum sp.]|uniref:hypothetical protein n=1 Tax=uncultured Faecalibaculum sp. TaxID=1729681 RepID=UPI0026179B1C|nr:hypothetical protein [uncultured Faecalibaculum sp.]